MTAVYAALIIGGGPAGLTAGIVLAGAGLRTLVCEQRQFAVDKACGEGVMPTGVAHLDRLGISRHLSPAHIRPFLGIRYHSPRGSIAAAPFAEGPGWGVRRTVLSAALLRRARELDPLEVREEVCAEPLARTAAGIVVRVGGDRVETRLLIGADGLHSRVRRWAGLEGRRQPLRRWGARQHFQVAPWSDYVEVYWTHGVEAYITPCSAEQTGVAFLWDRTRYPSVKGGAELFPSLLRAFPELQARLAAASACSEVRAIGPLHRSARAPVSDGVLLIGDAAGYLDAITGEGISLATAQALCLEQTVAPLLGSGASNRPPSARELSRYARTYRSIVKPYYQMTRLVLFLSYHPRLAERAIRLLGKQPDIFQHLLSANMGLTAPWAMRPRQFARVLKGLLPTF
ncbi:MAG TPA: NAD(P)/FAD-dependent oxidoreductase [Anaerolineae bacterium]|nr:NAD(P)/FAD-dependent oxidoreductase [Anaerolineae bacterium]